ncbi:MAG TPA: iron-containing redox enzyme family protein [Thermoanaerobaculia bacterium]|jgi:hypothetical protein|nr:iron-containing redox enzyme family protein [Thermoanaerobaculia bacterium]
MFTTNHNISIELANISDVNEIAAEVNRCEIWILNALCVEDRLKQLASSPAGLRRLISTFYFVRYDFCRMNFIVGSRCASEDEGLYQGIVTNLYEEMGGARGPSHNELYRQVLRFVGVNDEKTLKEPEFARNFNRNWEQFCSGAPKDEALLGIGIYEILDNPDYRLLLRVAKHGGISGSALRFFAVHAGAQHFDLFGSLVQRFIGAGGGATITSAALFVLKTQARMWSDLLSFLEERAKESGDSGEEQSGHQEIAAPGYEQAS